MWILTLINVLGLSAAFLVQVHEIGHIEIKAYKINHLVSFIYYNMVTGLLSSLACRMQSLTVGILSSDMAFFYKFTQIQFQHPSRF